MIREPRLGRAVRTFTGREAWPLDPHPEDFCIEDIAHALSLQPCFGGRATAFYSHAEHAVRATRIARGWAEPGAPVAAAERAAYLRRIVLATLLHEAAHAYLGEVATEVRSRLVGYEEARRALQATINLWAGLPPDADRWALVERCAATMEVTAARDLLVAGLAPGAVPITPPLPELLRPWTWQEAEQEFLALYWEVADLPALPYSHVHPCPSCYEKLPCNGARCVVLDQTDHGIKLAGFETCTTCKASQPPGAAGA